MLGEFALSDDPDPTMNKTTLDPRMADGRPSRLRILPTLLTLALAGTAASTAVEVKFQYYRFTPTKGRGGDAQNQIQMSEFEFFLRGTKVDHTPLTVDGAVTGGITHPINGNEGVSKLVDGDRLTKWFDDNKVPVTFNFGAQVTIDAYRFATANDSLERTPIRWILSGSNDGINFVTVDDRSGGDNATPTAFYTFRPLLITTPPAASGLPVFSTYNNTVAVVDNTVAGQDVYQSFPAIVKNAGPETSLTWNITNTPTSIALTPALPPPDLLFAETRLLTPIVPNGFTEYKMTATTATGSGALIYKIRSVPGGTANARYVRFTASALRDGNNLVQAGEFEFFNGATKLTGITVTNPGGNTNNNANEVAAKIIDGDFRTKWLNHNNAPLIFDLGSAQTFDGYQITTGNDGTGRDPVRWVLETSADGVNWSLLDNVYNYQPPSTRRAKSGVIPVGGIATREWTGSANGTWDTSTNNWVNSGTTTPAVSYSEGTAVVFGEAPTNREVSLTEPLAPNSVSALNTTGTYTISGAPISGPGDLFKRGAGALQLDNANTFQGAVYVEGGKLSLNNAEALGNRDILTRLQVSAGAELQVMTDVTTERRLRIGTGGGTINVDEGYTFTKIHGVDFLGTLTKTGFGTLRFNGYQGSTSFATGSDLVVNEGTVDFTGAVTGFNSRPFGGNAGDNMIVTVNSLGTLRWSVDNAIGGDYLNYQTSLDQVRVLGGVLDLANGGSNYFHVGLAPSGEGRLVLQGGVVTGNGQIEPAGLTPATPTPVRFTILPSADSSFIGGGGGLLLNPDNSTLEIDVADGEATEDLIVNRVISGGRPLVKMGAGNMVLAAPNTFSGTFTVSAGTVTLSNSSTGTSNATFATGTTLQGTGTMGSATVNGAVKIAIVGSQSDQFALGGTLDLGATSSLAISGEEFTEPVYTIISNTGARTGTFGTVTGVPSGYTLSYGANAITLVSSASNAYDVWATGLSDPSPEADVDGDGLANVLEFVLNSNATVSSVADAPDAIRNASGDFVFTFVMKADAAYLQPVVEYNTGLNAVWTTFAAVTTQPNTPSAGLITVTATLPAALASPEGKLFARLKVEVD